MEITRIAPYSYIICNFEITVSKEGIPPDLKMLLNEKVVKSIEDLIEKEKKGIIIQKTICGK